MPRKTASMHLLDSNGHRWPMTWLRDNETHMGLTRGWRDFCLAEGLSEGDVCIFDLIELNKLTLLIHVFRSSETRGSNQSVDSKSKRLDASHVGHSVLKKSSERKKVSEEEGRGLGGKVSMGGEDQLPTTLEKQRSFVPAKLVLYNAFHKTTLLSSARSSQECNRGENSRAGSVGRKRLKRLSFGASREQDCTYSSQRGVRHETDSLEGLNLQMGSKDGVEFIDGEMSKEQATTYGEILCQMSSSCVNVNTSTTWNIELNGNNGKVHTSQEHELEGQHSHVEGGMKKHLLANASWRPEKKEGVKPGFNTRKQWAKTRKLCYKYDKADKKKILGWTWSTPCSPFLKRKMQASSRNCRLYLASRRSTVTEAQREAAKDAAMALNTVNPTALVVMKKSNVYKTYTVVSTSSRVPFCR